VVLAVDDRVDPEWVDDYRRLADRVVVVPFPGSLSRAFAWLRGLCSGDWVFHVEDDEVPAPALAAELAETVARGDVTHAWVRRRWLYPDGESYLDQWPWSPDYQLRLFRNDPRLLRFPGVIHDLVRASGPCRYLREPLYHGRLVLTTEEERAQSAARQERARPGLVLDGLPVNEAYYLPERRSRLRLAAVTDRDAVDRFLAGEGPQTERAVARLERADASAVDRPWERRELPESAYRARVRLLERDLRIAPGEHRTFDVEVENLGDEPWPGGLDAHPQVRLAYRADGQEGLRTGLGAPLTPGERAIVPLQVVGPAQPGTLELEVDLVHEHVRWFGAAIRVSLVVEGAATDGEGTMGRCSARPSRTSSHS
jgi:hypothetical protein